MKISNKKFVCTCGKKIRISNAHLGKTGRCPNCDKKILVCKTFFEDESLSEDATLVDRTTIHSMPIIEKQFGEYEIEHKLGQGGMGIVYKAYETKIKRVVALKIISHGNENMVSRFQKEMEILGQLQHPNIVRLLSYGTEPQIYLTMEYLEGKPLSEIHNLSFQRIAKITQKVAMALQDAHDRGIIHRDIKPANIMLVNKEPKLMDFGLAKLQQDEEQISKTGELLGTVAYMSPEQAYGSALSNATDIYSLGATMYKLLTSRPPFEGDNNINIIFRVCYQDVVAPRALNPDIPVDLEAICLKCLEKDPRKRYASAKELADDIDNFLQGKSVIARPYTPLKKVYKYIGRHKVVFTLAFLCILICVVFTAVHIQYLKTSRLAAAEKHKASSKILAKFSAYNADITFNLGVTRESGLLTGRSLQFLEGLHGEDIDKIRDNTRQMLYRNLRHYGLVQRYLFDEKFPATQHIVFSGDGNSLVMINDSYIQIWDIRAHKIVARTQHSISQIVDVFVSANNHTFIVSANGQIYKYANERITLYCDVQKPISVIKFTFPYLYFASNKKLYALNIKEKDVALVNKNNKPITQIEVVASNIVCTSESHVQVYNTQTQKMHLWKKPKKMHSVALCHNGEYLVSYYEGYLQLFDLHGSRISRQKLGDFDYDNFGKVQLCTNPINDKIVLTIVHGQILITDFFDPQKPALIGYLSNTFRNFAIQPQAKYIATANKNGIYLWDRSFALHSVNISATKIRKLRFHHSHKLVVLQKQISVWWKNTKVWTSKLQDRILDFRIADDYIIVTTKTQTIIFTINGEIFYRCPQRQFVHIHGLKIIYYNKDNHCICIEDIQSKELQKLILPKESELTSLAANNRLDIFYTIVNNENTILNIANATLKITHSQNYSMAHKILKCIDDRAYIFSKNAHLKIMDNSGQVVEDINEVLDKWRIKKDYMVFLQNSHAIFFETNTARQITWLFPVENAYDVDFLGDSIVFACPKSIHIRNMAQRLTLKDFELHRLISSVEKDTNLSDYINQYPQKFSEQVFDGKLNENFQAEYPSY